MVNACEQLEIGGYAGVSFLGRYDENLPSMQFLISRKKVTRVQALANRLVNRIPFRNKS